MIKKIYLDLDLTLVDTACHALDWHEKPNYYNDHKNHGIYKTHTLANMSQQDFWQVLPTGFWANIPKLPWADILVKSSIDLVGEKNVFILTSPINTPACYYGKHLWIEKYMPSFSNRLIISSAKEACVGEDGFLVDDAEHNEQDFINAGKENNFYLLPSLTNKKSELALSLHSNPEAIERIMHLLIKEVNEIH